MVKEAVHRLVALAFIPQPEGCNVVNHLDSNRQNNNVENLEWTTVKGNTVHGYKYGRVKESQQKATEKAKEVNTKMYEVYKNGVLLGVYNGLEETARAANCNEKTVRNCLKADRISRAGFYFKCLGGE